MYNNTSFSTANATKWLRLNKNTVTHWLHIFRQAIAYINKNPVKLGGENV